MESLDYWRFNRELNVIQAALLIVGEDPSSTQHYVENWAYEKRPNGYDAVKSALMHDILSKVLPSNIRRSAPNGGYYDDAKPSNSLASLVGETKPEFLPDLSITTVRIEDLKVWLSKRGVKNGFFFPEGEVLTPDYLDKAHPNYSPKLAAAVAVWQAVNANPEMLRSKSLKEAMIRWLRTNAPRFGLIKPDGKLNENGITEVAKVANWKPEGGAPKQS